MSVSMTTIEHMTDDDPGDDRPSRATAIPADLLDALRGAYWPYATSTSRHVDYDHPTAYAHAAGCRPPPGQTGSHNSGPLGRRHHRWKTHAGFRSRQCGEGRYVWLTPHGMAFLVDHLGTRRVDPDEALAMFEAPAGVDLYFT